MTITATPLDEHGVHFGLAELDLLTTYAGTPLPFPLRVPSFGRIAGERMALLGAAGRSLAERGLATADEPVGVAADLVAALREHHSSVDLVLVHQGTVTGIAAMVHGDQAVVCRQPIGGPPGPVAVTKIAHHALADMFAGCLPVVAAAPAMPITLPPGVVGDATRLLENTAGLAAPRRRVSALVRERGGDESAVDALVTVLPSVTGRGQLGVVHRAGGERRPLELSWLDSPNGRVRVDHDDRYWVSINPLRHNELVRALRVAAALARQ